MCDLTLLCAYNGIIGASWGTVSKEKKQGNDTKLKNRDKNGVRVVNRDNCANVLYFICIYMVEDKIIY
jgi:hypothetical protein